jgi:uncharacterized protein YdgA (DUF945 family)
MRGIFMRKLWVVLSSIIVVLMAIALAVPFSMGLWVQKRYPEIISQFNTPHVSFELVNFQRGWFHSRAQLQITFHSAETTLSGESIPLARFSVSQKIQHGLVVAQKTPSGKKHWIMARAALQNESHADNLNFNANTIWTLANSLNTQMNIIHLLLGNDRQRIEINQLQGSIDFTPSDRHFQSQISLGSGTLYENNPERIGDNIIDLVKVLELINFNSKLDIRKIASIWYGNRHFEAGKITIFPYGGNVITANNFAADLNQNQHDQLTDFYFSNQAEEISDAQFKIGRLQIALALKDMDNALLENFAQIFMYGSDFQRFKLYSLLIDLFAKGMTVDLKQFQFTTEDGQVGMQAQLSSPLANAQSAGVLHLLENLNIQATANMPKIWLKKNLVAYYENHRPTNFEGKNNPENMAQENLDHWLEHHILVPQDGQVSLAINYQKGQLLINGEKPDLENFSFNNNSLSKTP